MSTLIPNCTEMSVGPGAAAAVLKRLSMYHADLLGAKLTFTDEIVMIVLKSVLFVRFCQRNIPRRAN